MLATHHAVYAFALIVFLIIIALMARRRPLEGRSTAIGHAVAGVLGCGCCLYMAVLLTDGESLWAENLLMIAIAASVAWFTVDLFAQTVQRKPAEAACLLCLAYLLFSLTWLVVEAAVPQLLSWALALCPAAMGISCIMSARRSGERGGGDSPDSPDSPASLDSLEAPDHPTLRNAFAGAPWDLLIVGCISVYFGVICVRVFTTMSQGSTGAGGLSAMPYILTAGAGLVLAGALLALFAKRGYSIQNALGALTVLALAYLAALLIVLVLPDSTAQLVAKRIMVAAEHCFEVLLAVVLVAHLHGRSARPQLPLALFAIIVLVLPQVIALDVLTITGALAWLSGVNLVAPVAAVGSFAIATGLAIMFLRAMRAAALEAKAAVAKVEAASAAAASAAASQANDDWQRALVHRAVAGHDITDREEDVVLLTYRGLSAKKAAEELIVSESTVKAHLQHAYNKLDVHTKQDLIKLIDSYR